MLYRVVRRTLETTCATSTVTRSKALFRAGMVRSCRSLSAEAGRLSSLPDVCGQPVITSSWKAIKSLDEAYTEYANLTGDPYRRTQEALEADPSCVMAHCLKGMLAALSHADPIAVDLSLADAERDLMEYEEGAEGHRERVFASALRAWSAGGWREGALYLETWLMSNPTDLPAVKLAQDAHITLGDRANMRDCVGRVLPFWSEAKYGYSNVLGMHAFGLVETGSYPLAEERADTALAMNQRDIWATHAMAHVYEMEARASEGCSFLNNRRDKWEDEAGPLQKHMAWHLGLFSLERGQERSALRVFDTLLAPPREGGQQDGTLRMPPPPPFALSDATSLLWRMDMLGVETGEERWRGVAEAWLHYDHARNLSTFHDLHAVMSFAAMANGVQDQAESDLWSARVEVLLQSMRDYVRSGGLRQTAVLSEEQAFEDKGLELEDNLLAPRSIKSGVVVPLHSFSAERERDRKGDPNAADTGVVRRGLPDNLWVAEHVGIPLCEAMSTYRKGCYEEVVSKLLPLRYHAGAIGGSRAQEDVVHLTLIDAASRIPDQTIARTLVCERRSQRPTSGRAWEAYGIMMDKQGDPREAHEARKVAFGFGIGQGGVGAN